MKNNFIHYQPKVLSSKDCKKIIKFFEDNPSLYIKGRLGEDGKADRTKLESTEITLNLSEGQWINIKKALAKTLKEYKKVFPLLDTHLDPWHLQPRCQLMKYEPAKTYWRIHCERAPTYSQRLLAWMIHLNTIQKGGKTVFVHQKIKVKPKEGGVYIWPADWTHMHHGEIAPTEFKYIITGWYDYNS